MENLQIERRESIVWFWLNRPHKLNAMDRPLLFNLRDHFVEISKDSSVRAVVLAGRGRAFSSGFDINWMVDRTPDQVRSDRSQLREVFDTIANCPHPVICAVHGDAMGGALILTMVCDLVIASENSRFGAPEVKIGVFPSLGLVPRLERLVGIRAAKYIVMTGEPVDVETAHRIGLVNAVCAQSHLFDEAQRLADQIAQLPQNAVQVTKASFTAQFLTEYAEWEAEKAAECWAVPDRNVAMRQFLARKKRRS